MKHEYFYYTIFFLYKLFFLLSQQKKGLFKNFFFIMVLAKSIDGQIRDAGIERMMRVSYLFQASEK